MRTILKRRLTGSFHLADCQMNLGLAPPNLEIIELIRYTPANIIA